MDFKNFENELKLRAYSADTIKNYIYFNKRFLDFIKKSPKDINQKDIKKYILYMIENYGAKPATINMMVSSFKCYYNDFMKRKFNDVKRAKPDQKTPYVITKFEILAMIDSLSNPKHKLLIELLYSSGLRVSEAVNLKIEDIYFRDKLILIKQGKGRKDRYVVTSSRFIQDLLEFLEKRKDDNPYVFISSHNLDGHLSKRTVDKVIKSAARKAGIKRRVFPHALRASFATHLYENGVDVLKLQKLLGHSRVETTKFYTKTNFNMINSITSPLD